MVASETGVLGQSDSCGAILTRNSELEYTFLLPLGGWFLFFPFFAESKQESGDNTYYTNYVEAILQPQSYSLLADELTS